MKQTQEEQVTIHLEDAICKYGRPKLLSRQEAVEAFNTRNHGLVCLILDVDMFEIHHAFYGGLVNIFQILE